MIKKTFLKKCNNPHFNCKENEVYFPTFYLMISVKELKIVLEKLIEDKGLRERMGKKSIEVVLEKFSIEKMLKQTKDLYNKILKK